MARKRHKTPEELDAYFDRGVVLESEYGAFWKAWHGASRPKRLRMMEELDLRIEEREGRRQRGGQRVKAPPPTSAKVMAERQAAALGGYVVRRDRFGKFSKRGRSYQVVIPKGRTKRRK